MNVLGGARDRFSQLKHSCCVSPACLVVQDLDVAIVKATNHVEAPPKEKHVRSKCGKGIEAGRCKGVAHDEANVEEANECGFVTTDCI